MLGLSPQRGLRFNFRPCRKEGLEADEESKGARALSIGIYECEHFAEYAITLRHVHRARLHNDIIADLECHNIWWKEGWKIPGLFTGPPPPPWNSVVSKSRKFIFLVKDLLAGWDHDGLFLIVTIGDKGFQLFREDVRCGFSPVFVIAHLEYHLK